MKNGNQGKTGQAKRLSGLEQSFGRKIRGKRKARGWTQKQLANGLGISYQQVQKYETGVNRVSAGRLYQIAQLLSLDIGVFFRAGQETDGREISPVKKPTVQIEGDLLTDDVQAALNNLVRALAKRIH